MVLVHRKCWPVCGRNQICSWGESSDRNGTGGWSWLSVTRLSRNECNVLAKYEIIGIRKVTGVRWGCDFGWCCFFCCIREFLLARQSNMKGKASLLMSKPIFIRKEKGLGLNPSRWKHEGQDDEFEGWVGQWSDLRWCLGALSNSQRIEAGETGLRIWYLAV